MARGLNGQVAICGVGYTPVARYTGRQVGALGVEAAVNALHDAGLRPSAIDGVGGATGPDSVDPLYIAEGIGVERLRWHAATGQPSIFGVIECAWAVAAGACDYALCYRAMRLSPARRGAGEGAVRGIMGDVRPTGQNQFKAPYGGTSIVTMVALYAQRHMHEYGTRREHLGQVAINGRRNAALNPRAVFRDPITMADYLNAPMIADPFGLLDCDVPADVGMALILTTPERARDLPTKPVFFEAATHGLGHRSNWEQWGELDDQASAQAGRNLWERTTLRPADVDVAEIYDGFSWLTLNWLEALGICGKGESGPFVEGGRIAREGEFPINTHGGNLGEGRSQGMGMAVEAALQLRGEGGPRQVTGARVALACGGAGPLAGCLLLTAEASA
jgi:acetyl-CoA acetyltransferase